MATASIIFHLLCVIGFAFCVMRLAIGCGITFRFMCRSIKVLRQPEEVATEDEIRAAALQYIRKVSGSRQPSKRNLELFDLAVDEVAAVTSRLLAGWSSPRSSKTQNA
jgi:hypothetical protein